MSRLKITYGEDRFVASWAAEQIGAGGGFSSDVRAIGLENEAGELIAATMWDYITLYSCVMSVASNGSKRWMSRGFLFRSFAYPFLQLNLRRATCLIAEGNTESIRLCNHVGFVEEGRLARNSGDQDDIIFRMFKEDCRWITPEMAKLAHKEA